MTLSDYLPVLIQFVLAFTMAIAILALSALLGQKSRRSAIKDSPYECGMLPIGPAHPKFSVKFYLVAMLFILFDIEIVFLLPWCLILRESLAQQLPVVLPGLFFIFLLSLGLLYEWKRGALRWG